jgi:hypothetical protein
VALDPRRTLATALGVSGLVAGALVGVPAHAAESGTLHVQSTGTRVSVTAAADLAPFGAEETLLITGDSKTITITMDSGSPRLWSEASGCTSAPRSAPVLTITCTGAWVGAAIDLSQASVSTQSALVGLLPLTFTGGTGADYAQGGLGADTISGGLGDDDLFGEAGDDVIDGGPGADTVEGELGVDTLLGGPGADSVEAQDEIADRLIDCGGQARDSVSYDKGLEDPIACDGPEFAVMHPRAGPLDGGTRVALHGRGLGEVKAVSFASASATIVTASDTELVVLTPPGAGAAGVVLDFGDATLAGGQFTFAAPPIVRSVTPASGRAGTVITLSGTHLTRVSRIIIGGISVLPRTSKAGQLTVIAPATRRLGRADITVITAGGRSVVPDAFRYTS